MILYFVIIVYFVMISVLQGSKEFVLAESAELMFSTPRQLIPRILLILCLIIINSTAYQVIQEVSGSVGAGEYRLYNVELTSTLALVLISDQGDGDLYVSLSKEPPTFELYDFASQTCGAEIIILPLVDKRERSVAMAGVYGHIRYNTTQYHLHLISCEVDVEYLDTLQIANDPLLVNIVKKLQLSGPASDETHIWTSLRDWTLWLLIHGLEFGVEVFL